MKLKNILFASAILIATVVTTVSAQTKLIEKVNRKGSELVIPYEKYVLSNGLTLLVHEDHSDPIVYVDVTYHVGSAREQEGRSGFAHFFEHMLFEGSEHIGKGEHFKILTAAGATLNGSTNTDRTNYWEIVPANYLETCMWLESDRMGYFIDSVTQAKFENQRSTVKNERGQRYDNVPYGVVREKIAAAMYPPSNPYSWLTIGYIEDLNRVDVNDLKKFFLRWYGPNNATLTVAGDVKVADVIKQAEKYFGSIPPCPDVKPQTIAPVVLDNDRYISYEDNIRAPQVNFTWAGVPSNHADEAPLDVLADVLAGGKASIFYQNFVKSEIAQSARASNNSQESVGEFSISVRAFPDKRLSQMDSMIRSSLAEFEKRGVTEDDLKKFKAGFESNMVNSLSSVQGKGGMLAAYQTYTGNPNYIVKDMARYNGVSKEDVMRVYNTYIKGKHAVVLSVYPKGKPNLAKPNSFKPMARNTNAEEGAEYKNLANRKAKTDFDRTKQPAPSGAVSVKVPDVWMLNYANGMKIIGSKSDEVPNVTIQVNVEAGHRYESKAQAGISSLLTSLMSESTTKHTAEEISEKLDMLGSTVNIQNNGQDVVLYISSLTKNLDATLAIAEEVFFHPRFDQKEFDRVKKQKLVAIANQVTQATTIANNVYSKLLYGKEHIMSISSLGTKETVEALTLDDLKKYYEEYFSPTVSNLVIVGDIAQEVVMPKLDFLKNWKGKTFRHNPEPTLPVIDKTRIYFVNKDKAPQSEIRIGYMAMPFDAVGEYYKSTIMNYILGGAFNSRINMNLREHKGWTYGARSSFSGNKFTGPYTANAGVRANATDSSVVEFMKEMRNYSKLGITEEELVFTKSSIGQADALKYETAGQKATFIKRLMDFNLEKNYVDKQNEILKGMTKHEIDELAMKRLPFSNMVILVVGDKTRCWEGLNKLGYEVIELDTDGNPLGKDTKRDALKPSDSKHEELIKDEPAKANTPANPKGEPIKTERRDIKPR